jgi:Inhibitor of vertebrate lysozyme (Ivy)
MNRLPAILARLGLMATLVLASAPILSIVAAAAELPYLFQQLNSRHYKNSFRALFQGEKSLAPWLRDYLRSRNGVDTPGQMVEATGVRYELYEVCQPHNCPGNYIYVLFAPGGSKAWALLTREGGDYRFFGHPGPQQQALLSAAANR